MAATTLDRNTRKRKIDRQIVLALKAATVIPVGVIVTVETPSAGALNGAQVAGHIVMGMSCQRADASAGDTKIVVERGVFQWANNGNITAAHVGLTAFLVDNQTVGLAADTNPDIPVGQIQEVDADGVWVDSTDAAIA